MAPNTPTEIALEKKRPRWWLRILLGLVIFAVVFVLTFWWMLRSAPSFWDPPDSADPAVAQTAEKVESFVATQTTQVRPEEEKWTVELSQDQVNAWLASRLPQWLKNQDADPDLIDAIPRAMMKFSDQRLQLAVEVHVGKRKQVFAVAYSVDAPPDRPVTLRLQSLTVGRVPLPVGTIIEMIAKKSGGNGPEIRRAVEAVELKIPLDDGREVAVTGLKVTDGKLTLTCATRRKK